MRRRRASTNMSNAVHSGWMIKSPPERKLNAPFKIFRSQWKRRYFVLRKPSGSLPDQYELHYYKDEKCSYKKGSIDLEQCEQIIESLDSELFPYLLAIKTVCRSKVRTYYLAVDTEQEMGSWVQWLCHVCGMKQEDEPTDIPEPRSPSISAPTPGTVSNGRPWTHSSVVTTSNTTATTNTSGSGVGINQSVSLSQRVPSEESLDSSPSYIPLDGCTTGQPQPQRVDRAESVESVPEFNAPSPPMPRGTHQDTEANEDDVFVSGSFGRPPKTREPPPPPRSTASMDLYTVPPVRPPRPGETEDQSDEDRHASYDIPPPRRRQSPKRSSLSTDSRKDSLGSSGGRHNPPSESYDYPPPRLSSTTSSDCDVLSGDHSHQPSPYQNIPSSAKSTGSVSGMFDLNTVVPPPRPHPSTTNQNQGYDIPRSSKARQSQTPQPKLSTVLTPPPPRPHRPIQSGHAYLNTQDGQGESGELNYTNVSASPPAIPPPRHNSNSDQQDGVSGSPKSGVYHIPPPSSASSSSSASSGPPARPPARTVTNANPLPPPIAARNPDLVSSQMQEKGDDGGVIFSTHRTRSFKKQHNINIPIKASNKAHTLPLAAPVPAPRPVQPPRPNNYSSSEDGDEEATHHPISLLRSVPPPFDAEPELKYIDLELPDSIVQDAPKPPQSDHHHHRHHSHAHNHVERSKPDSSIEYREIDFVKTKALKDTKKEKDRQNDDHNA